MAPQQIRPEGFARYAKVTDAERQALADAIAQFKAEQAPEAEQAGHAEAS